jgi:DNA-binding winged helix-turn-helix (wHTH) protein
VTNDGSVPVSPPVPSRHSPRCYAFGEYQLDLSRRLLHRGTDAVSITSRAFDVLAFLVLSNGRPVMRDELIAAVWANTHVTGGNLNQAIRALRRAFQDDRNAPSFIATLPHQGYRFVAPVRVVAD